MSSRPARCTMALQPIIATVEPDTIARILATNGYRLKSEVRLLVDEYAILQHLDYAEESRVNKTAWEWFFYHYSARHNDLRAATTETIAKLAEVERQLVRFENEGLPQATFSVWGTEMTLLERSHITKALEPQAFEDGAVLIKQGEPRDAFFIIVQGKVSCTRDHRCKVAPPVPPFWSASARQCLSAPAKPRHSPGMPGPRCSARQGCASRRETQSATKGPWRLAASSAASALPRRLSRALTPQARRGRDRAQARLLADQPAVRVHRDRGR